MHVIPTFMRLTKKEVSSVLLSRKRPASIICHSCVRAESTRINLRQDVINLYKNLIYLSREWPTDLRPQIKQAFMKNKAVEDPEEIRKLIGRGEYVCREITATYHLRKYRAMKRRYYSEHRDKQMDEMFKNFSQ